ncbi:hypothetical protein AB205_0109680 [Aquarana catesbeiana]|uniref:Uncharacterized protein n=1 Tax=Aquarana catesbeiana TaxID=8400 RepID=A0A2G9P2A9_AQUCT|nr:hypothetical protein AB205_0109680 [Aquarana catesbeiana]
MDKFHADVQLLMPSLLAVSSQLYHTDLCRPFSQTHSHLDFKGTFVILLQQCLLHFLFVAIYRNRWQVQWL